MRRNDRFSLAEVTGTARCGMSLVLTRWVALSGTVQLLNEHGEVLRQALPQTLIDQAFSFSEILSDFSDTEVAVRCGVASFCESGPGGIYHALWDLAAASGVGVEAYMDAIPIRQETVEICEVLDMDPYKLDSRGCLLMACQDPEPVCEAFFAKGIEASVIGCVTEGKDRVIITGGTKRFISPRE
ncbi:MAG: hypothetical protein K6B14_04035 [Lachnospiraceae bacterium]|nr:hypothetical protein [Lachnospiraceae bacterium]